MEWGALEERFGWASEREELRAVPDADKLEQAWGGPDLNLYDTYVSGHVSTILTGHSAGAEVLAEAPADARLARYFELCLAEASDDESRREIEMCRDYFEHLNQMLEVGRRVPRR